MSDFESQHELDDELLSAYLDGELSMEDRAAVEARLAADPAVEQMLHQLRAVSQAMQGLPQEALGYDLRESVLGKAVQQADSRAKSAVGAGVSEDDRSAANGAAADADVSVPTLTIGRTRRGWVWASLAAAAALLIMVFQSRPERGRDLPAVAKRDTPSAVEGRSRVTNEEPLAFRALREPAAPTGATAAAGDDVVTAESELRTREWSFAENEPAAAPSPNEVASGGQRASRLATEIEAAPRSQNGEPAGALGMATRGYSKGAVPERSATGSLAEAPADAPAAAPVAELAGPQQSDNASGNIADAPVLGKRATEEKEKQEQFAAGELVVVRLVAKRTALEGREFEQLLERNGIEVEAEAPADDDAQQGAYRGARRYSQQGKNELGDLELSARDGLADAATAADVLLVQAPMETIQSCLNNLYDDTANYVSVAVDDVATADANGLLDAGVAADYFMDVKDKSGKKLAEDLGWTKYRRGDAPREGESLGRAKLGLSYELEKNRDSRSADRQVDGGFGGAGAIDEVKQQRATSGKKSASESNRGRARRLRALPLGDPERGESARRGGNELQDNVATDLGRRQLSQLRRQLEPRSGEGGNSLPVLFVLTPEAPEKATSSPAAENRAE